jgi:hypothetical protein
MNPNDPNLPLLESVMRDLGEFLERFLLLGGCATGLLVTNVATAPVRAPQGVDVIAEVLPLTDHYALERELSGIEISGRQHNRGMTLGPPQQEYWQRNIGKDATRVRG